jgi:hypothetical protein
MLCDGVCQSVCFPRPGTSPHYEGALSCHDVSKCVHACSLIVVKRSGHWGEQVCDEKKYSLKTRSVKLCSLSLNMQCMEPKADDQCRPAGGKSGIDKRVCSDDFVVRIPESDLRYQEGAPGDCDPSIKMNPHQMEVFIAHFMKELKTAEHDLHINTYQLCCKQKVSDGTEWVFRYKKLTTFSEYMKRADAAAIGDKIEKVRETLKKMWSLCQFSHGDMKVDQILMEGDNPLLNDFDKSSFTVLRDSINLQDAAPVRIRPTKRKTTIPIISRIIGHIASKGIDASLSYSEIQAVRNSRCPLQDGWKFDAACLWASALLLVDDAKIEELARHITPCLKDWINLDAVKRVRSEKKARLGSISSVSKCVIQMETNKPVLHSRIRWVDQMKFAVISIAEDRASKLS